MTDTGTIIFSSGLDPLWCGLVASLVLRGICKPWLNRFGAVFVESLPSLDPALLKIVNIVLATMLEFHYFLLLTQVFSLFDISISSYVETRTTYGRFRTVSCMCSVCRGLRLSI